MSASLPDALLAVAAGDREAAAAIAAACPADPSDALMPALRRALAEGGSDVYSTPTGFQAFIDNASNVALYDATIAHLRQRHHDLRPASVVDVGCGDGRVTHATLASSVREIHLVEPSAALLAEAAARSAWPAPPVPHNTDLAGFLAALDPAAHFELVQSTFALHTIRPLDRALLLNSLRAHTDRLVVVDFDVPVFSDRSREHADYVVNRYRKGVQEYASIPEAIDGFLMPVLLGQFDPAAQRHTFEQPAAQWIDDLSAAGFSASSRFIHEYWWGPAFCIEATPT